VRPRDEYGDPIRPEDVLDEQELADYYNSKAVQEGRRPPYPDRYEQKQREEGRR
jgi:hypothetical protein